MCGICGVLGEPAHWSSAQGRLRLAMPASARAERARMVRMLNRIARTRNVQISDWQGCAYLVAGATGRQELVPSLAQVWLALDRLRGAAVGPPRHGGGRRPPGGGGVMDGGLRVNVLTGFLGSGKTSLLNRLLRDPAFSHCAVLINEFGTIGIDHHLVEAVDGDLVLLSSGCVCCTIRGDLRAAIRGLYERRERGAGAPVPRLLIETTGLADPTPVLATVMHDPVLRAHLRAGNVITTVDAVHAHGQLERHPQTRKQVAVADPLMVTKAEPPNPPALAALLQELAPLNPAALVCLAGPKALDAQALLGQDMFQKQGKSEELGRWLDAARQRRYAPVQHGGAHGGIESFVLEPGNDVDWLAFSLWLSLLLHRHGAQVLRVKGLIHVAGASTPVAIHGVQQLMHPPLHLPHFPHP